MREKTVGAGNGGGGVGWGGCGCYKNEKLMKTANIPRLVVVPEKLTKVSDLIFFCKRKQM